MKSRNDSISMPQSPFRRKMLSLASIGLASAFLTLGSTASMADDAGKTIAANQPLKFVLHVSAADSWPAALSNVKNLSAQHPEAKLRVIADGSGVYLYQGSTNLTPVFKKYSGLGVEFQACHNALDEKHISPASLPSFIQVVPSGVVAIAKSEYDGYAYIKP